MRSNTVRGSVRAFLVLIAMTFGVIACADSGTTPRLDVPDSSFRNRITVTEDQVALDDRVEYVDEVLTFTSQSSETNALDVAAVDDPVELKLLAEVTPPKVDGHALQASHLVLNGGRAYVSYNYAGGPLKGAIDVFRNITGNTPRLSSNAAFHDADLSAIAYANGRLYMATGAIEGSFKTTAVMEVARLRNGGHSIETTTVRAPLPSFVGTGVAVRSNRVYVVSGNDGGLSVFDRWTLQLLSYDPFPDGRAVATNGDWLVALKGSPAELRVYDRDSGSFLRSVAVGGATVPESKAGLAIVGDVAVVAAGDGGVRLIDLEKGAVIATVPVPSTPDGVDPADVVVNDVAVRNDLIFVAAGAAGLQVLRASDEIDELDGDERVDLQWVGRVNFSDPGSVNFVDRRGNRLFVAGGAGGLKIIAFDD